LGGYDEEDYTMLMLLAGLLLFFVPHSVSIVAPKWRDRIVLHMGGSWKGLYSLLSAAGLILIVIGFVHARRSPLLLYTSPAWLRHVTFALMLPVFPLLLAAYLPGRIQAAARHPMLLAVMLWASAHLLVNGTLADVLLFGAFLLWALFDRLSLRTRVRASVPRLPPSGYNDLIAVVLGLALYALFIARLHQLLIGVPLMVQ
jgi:uncharacterized membrane protein